MEMEFLVFLMALATLAISLTIGALLGIVIYTGVKHILQRSIAASIPSSPSGWQEGRAKTSIGVILFILAALASLWLFLKGVPVAFPHLPPSRLRLLHDVQFAPILLLGLYFSGRMPRGARKEQIETLATLLEEHLRQHHAHDWVTPPQIFQELAASHWNSLPSRFDISMLRMAFGRLSEKGRVARIYPYDVKGVATEYHWNPEISVDLLPPVQTQKPAFFDIYQWVPKLDPKAQWPAWAVSDWNYWQGQTSLAAVAARIQIVYYVWCQAYEVRSGLFWNDISVQKSVPAIRLVESWRTRTESLDDLQGAERVHAMAFVDGVSRLFKAPVSGLKIGTLLIASIIPLAVLNAQIPGASGSASPLFQLVVAAALLWVGRIAMQGLIRLISDQQSRRMNPALLKVYA